MKSWASSKKMKRLFLALALVLSSVAAQAQIVTEPFSGGTITTPLLGPDSCVTPTYSFTSDPASGFGSDGTGLCVRDTDYYTLVIDDGAGNLFDSTVGPGSASYLSTDGTESATFDLVTGFVAFLADDGSGANSALALTSGAGAPTFGVTVQDNANYSLSETWLAGDINLNAEFTGTTDNADLLLNADVPLVRLQTTFGTDIAEINTNTGSQIVLDADIDNDGDGTVIARSENNTQLVQVGSNAVLGQSDAEVSLRATDGTNVGWVDILVTPQVDISSTDGTDEAEISVGATSIILDADVDDDSDGSIDLLVDNSTKQIGMDVTGVVMRADDAALVEIDSATDDSRVFLTPTTVEIDADVDNDGDGTVTLSADNSAATVVLSTTSVDIDHDTDITLDADDATNNASLNLDGDGNLAALSVTDGTDTTDSRMTQNTILLDADVDDDADGTVTIEAANSTSQVVVNSTGVSITNYLFADSVAFASLGAPADGAIVYCTDCDAAVSPCQSTPGTGAFAFRQNGAWACPF